jgi:hypothetical protein
MSESTRPKSWAGPWSLEIAHIASGQGRAIRVDDARAVIVLCSLAHRVHVSDSDKMPHMHIGGEQVPTIDERHTLWIKQQMDGELDEEFLRGIWHGSLPTPEKPPAYWCKLFTKNLGILR